MREEMWTAARRCNLGSDGLEILLLIIEETKFYSEYPFSSFFFSFFSFFLFYLFIYLFIRRRIKINI